VVFLVVFCSKSLTYKISFIQKCGLLKFLLKNDFKFLIIPKTEQQQNSHTYILALLISGGPSSYEGNVFALNPVTGIYGPICDDGWTITNVRKDYMTSQGLKYIIWSLSNYN